MDKQQKWHAWYFVAAFLGVTLLAQLWSFSQNVVTIPYSQFLDDLKGGKIAEVRVSGDYIEGDWKEPQKNGAKRFVTTRVPPQLADELEQNHVRFSGQVQNTFVSTLLSWIVPTLMFFGIWYFWFRRVAQSQGGIGGLMSIGRSKAKVYVETDTKTTFKDVAGEAGVPFFSINGSEFVEMFVGVGAARVRDLFVQAREKAPAIIFIDELDAMGRARGAYPYMGHDEKEQTLNQLLVELDGFDSKSGLVLLAATNRPEILDPALLRAGRFDRQVLVDRPDKLGRIEIVNLYLKRHQLAADVSAEKIAELTPGFTGADLENLVNEAALVATRRNANEIGMNDFTEAVERIVAGLEKKKRVLTPKERQVVAYHEMGHALVAMSLPNADPVHKISIIPRGVGALGYTLQRPTEDRFVITRDELLDKMAVLLGGRAAEWVVFERLSTGAADDLAKVTDIARDMTTRFGMDPSLGPVSYESAPSPFLSGPPELGGMREKRYSDETAHVIDRAVQQIVDASFERTSGILKAHEAVLDRGAKLLLERETLDENALKPIRAEIQAGIPPLGVGRLAQG